MGEEGAGGGGEAGGGRGRSRQRWAAPSMERRSGSSGEEKWGKERERVDWFDILKRVGIDYKTNSLFLA